MDAKEASDKLLLYYKQDTTITNTLDIIYNIISHTINRGENTAKIHKDIFGNCFIRREGNCDYGAWVDTEFTPKQQGIIRILKSKGYKLDLPSGLSKKDYLTISW